MLQNIKMIELEINKLCNRTCPWCPNSKIDRKGSERINFQLILKLLWELREAQFGKNWYGGFISFSRNNEPFADAKYLDDLTGIIKDYLPYVTLVSNTNGDFLYAAMESRIDELSIMDYDCKGFTYWKQMLYSYGMEFVYRDDNIVYFKSRSKKVAVCLNWPEHTLMEDRGGFFTEPASGMKWRDKKKRTVGCKDPSMFVAIDYNGSVMPCCCLRSDYHTDEVLGNLKDQSLEEILTGEKATAFRIAASTPCILPEVCQYCHKGIGRYTRENPGIGYSERYIKGGKEPCL